MSRRTAIWAALNVAAARAEISVNPKTVQLQSHGADPTGRADCTLALESAISALGEGGGTVLAGPGRFMFRRDAVKQFTHVSTPLRIIGDGKATTTFVLSGIPGQYGEFVRVTRGQFTVANLSMQVTSRMNSVLLNVTDGDNVRLEDLNIAGNAGGAVAYSHVLQLGLGNGRTSGVTINRCEVGAVSFPVLISNASTATIGQIRISNSRFPSLDFNCPGGRLSDIRITNTVINGAGTVNFGLAFAHVQDVTVEDCIIKNSAVEAVHIEDDSHRIRITRTHLHNNGLRAKTPTAHVRIIQGSDEITLERVRICTTASREELLIAAQQGGTGRTAGGRDMRPPGRVVVDRCDIRVRGSHTIPLYAEAVRGLTIKGSTIRQLSTQTQRGTILAQPAVKLVGGSSINITGNTFVGWRVAVESVQRFDPRRWVTFVGNDTRTCGRAIDWETSFKANG